MGELGTRRTDRKSADRKLSAYGCARRDSTRRAEILMSGSVRGAPGDGRPYRD